MSVNSGRLYARLLGGAAVLALSAGAAWADPANFSIAPQPLSMAVNAFSEQSGRAVLLKPELADKLNSPGVSGSLEPQIALAQMLAGTGLTYRQTGDTFLIERADAPQSGSAAGDGADGTVAALVVTAQKREENIQDVPIAISAFTEKSLEEQKIEGGFDLVKAVPNVTFSKNNFTGYNFSIRGIGTKAVSVTTDPGVAVSFNNTTLIRNRLFEQEYFDIERVEVLRGPQGTLYGRNATSGVVNVISAKPDMDEFKGSIKGEVGNYHAKRLVAMVNVPLVEDKLALRLAGSLTQRQGYGVNLYDNSDADGRDLWSARATLAFKPNDRFRANLIWERFNEDDNRARTGKQLCTRDVGPDAVGGYVLAPQTDPLGVLQRGFFSQGCLPGSLYNDKAFAAPNGLAIPFVLALELFGVGIPPNPELVNCGNLSCPLIHYASDPYGNVEQSRDLRALYSQLKSFYRANADVVEINLDFDVTDSLLLSSQTAYDKDSIYSTQDFNRYTTFPVFTDTSTLDWTGGAAPSPFRNVVPGGIFCDPQLGCSRTIVGMDLSRAKSHQFSQEFRLQSSFEGPLNFNAGLTYTNYKTTEDYYVFFNGITMAGIALVNAGGFANPGLIVSPDKYTTNPDCTSIAFLPICTPIENNSVSNIQDTGHNYFLSRNPYKLDSRAVFGEVYWQASETLKVTAGIRYTDDRKTFTPIPSQTLLTGPEAAQYGPIPIDALEAIHYRGLPLFGTGQGYPAGPDIKKQWREVTGRFGVDWKPDVPFTDQTMLYAFYSRGYKGGGLNPPGVGLNYDQAALLGIIFPPSAPADFRPEFVNAYEVGAKNTLLGGGLVLNAATFLYDYKDYQVSKIVDRSANNENFDAKVWGFELESVFQPTRNLRFNASLGFLDTELADGSKSIDIMNRTAGNADYVVLKPIFTLMSNCIAPASIAAQVLTVESNGSLLNMLCPGGNLFGQNFSGRPSGIGGSVGFLPDGSTYDPAEHPEINYGAGIETDVSGHELPNSPHFTVTLGGQYSFEFLESWKATIRADFYWQSQQWARIYELPIDKLHAWKNGNVSLLIERPDDGLALEIYAKNVFNDTPITDTFLNSDDTALTTNIFVLDPRLIGLSIKKQF